jgi:hypothetical protein
VLLAGDTADLRYEGAPVSDQVPPPQLPPPPAGWGQQPALPPNLPAHPKSTTALVLGIVGLAGGLVCWLPLVVSPFAWAMGRKAVKEIDASPGTWSGREAANAGFITGVIGTVILGLALAAMAVVMAVFVTGSVVASEFEGACQQQEATVDGTGVITEC